MTASTEIRRANIGCGSIQPEGWFNFDVDESVDAFYWDIRKPLTGGYFKGWFEYAVCHHALCALDHHELPVALRNIHDVLKPGGVLRISVPDLETGIRAYVNYRGDWFPQDERITSVDARFCTWLTWFGTQKSVFTFDYLTDLLQEAGFNTSSVASAFGATGCPDEAICDLDSREEESLFVEAIA